MTAHPLVLSKLFLIPHYSILCHVNGDRQGTTHEENKSPVFVC